MGKKRRKVDFVGGERLKRKGGEKGRIEVEVEGRPEGHARRGGGAKEKKAHSGQSEKKHYRGIGEKQLGGKQHGVTRKQKKGEKGRGRLKGEKSKNGEIYSSERQDLLKRKRGKRGGIKISRTATKKKKKLP